MIQPDRSTWQEPAPGGEWHMWRAVLSLALFDLSSVGRRDEALEWLMDDATHTGAAPWICEQLDLDLAAVRARARQIYEGEAHLTAGVTKRTWQRRTNQPEPYHRTVNGS